MPRGVRSTTKGTKKAGGATAGVLKEKSQPTRKKTVKKTAAKKATTKPVSKGKAEMEENKRNSKKRDREAEDEAIHKNEIPQPKRPKVTVANETPSAEEPRSFFQQNKKLGQVMVMGQGDTGQLGLGENIMEKKKPSPIGGVLGGLKMVQVVCGGMHTAALTDRGKVYTWGCNDEGALGRHVKDGEEYSPGLVNVLGDMVVVQLSAGDSHTAALTQNGDVYCCGIFRDSSGPFGLIHAEAPSPIPKIVYCSSPPNAPAVKIASGSNHTVILTSKKEILSFGCAEQGQLGRVPEIFSFRGGRKGAQFLLEPQFVRFRKPRNAPKPKFIDIFCGSYHTFAVTEDKAVYSWGLNNYGQLGTNDTTSHFQPCRLPEDWIEDHNETDRSATTSEEPCSGLVISGGEHHTLVCHNGRVFVMGRREYGRLGLGKNETDEPQIPKLVPGLVGITSVCAGTVCSFAVSKSGEVFGWGMGTSLQLGTGKEDDEWTPVKINLSKKVLGLSAGGQHTSLHVE